MLVKFLHHSWREKTGELSLSKEELEYITPILIESGAGGLAWNQVRLSSFRETEFAESLHQGYRFVKLRVRLRELAAERAFKLFRTNGIEPILIKGWTIARFYADNAMRHYSDVDFFIPPDKFNLAQELFLKEAEEEFHLDLRIGTGYLDEYTFDEVFSRSKLVKLGETDVRVLSHEDLLRVACYHWLHDGGVRFTGLCDIALLVESRPENFDWKICLGGSKTRVNWIVCAIKLSEKMLGANLSGVPDEVKNFKVPKWLIKAVLKQWSRPIRERMYAEPSLFLDLKNPLRFIKSAIKRFPPNPIQSTIMLKGSFNKTPRLPYQMGYYLLRVRKFLRTLFTGRSEGYK